MFSYVIVRMGFLGMSSKLKRVLDFLRYVGKDNRSDFIIVFKDRVILIVIWILWGIF